MAGAAFMGVVGGSLLAVASGCLLRRCWSERVGVCGWRVEREGWVARGLETSQKA